MTPRIFRYVVRFDGGSAPRPYGGVCTLAICKPGIRRGAKINDWIIGVRSREHDKIVYVMQVANLKSLGEYWCDAHFPDRRPGASPVPDNIYQPDANGNLEQVPNEVHDLGNRDTDISGTNALIGVRFWYFGANSPTLPTDLIHLVPYARNYTVDKNRRTDDVKNLEHWLATWPCGVHGDPINASDKMLAWLASAKKDERQSPVIRNTECNRSVTNAAPQTSASTTRCRR